MIKVLVVGMTHNPGGMESCVMNYYRNIDRNEIQFDFLTYFDDMVYRAEVEKNGSKVFVIPAKGQDPIKYKKEVNSFFNNYATDYDAIWCNTCSLANIDFLKLAKKYGIKRRIIHAHNSQNDSTKLKGIMHQLHKRVIDEYATDFWCCSWDAAHYFFPNKICKEQNIQLITNAINLEDFKYNDHIRFEYRNSLQLNDKIIVGHVGRFNMQKNHDFLIDVFNELVKKNPQYHLLLIGQGELEDSVKNKVKSLNLENNVSFLGVRNDVPCLLQAMDLFLFPSLFEGLGIALVEAQAAGLQCFTSATVVPQAADVTGLVKYIDLEKSPVEWADTIVSTNLYEKREDIYKKVTEAGYDIHNEAIKMVELLGGSKK